MFDIIAWKSPTYQRTVSGGGDPSYGMCNS